MAHLSEDELKKGVVAASAGNHAQGVAYAARQLDVRAVIVMPLTTPAIKVDAVRAMGAEVVLAGDTYADGEVRCDEIRSEQDLTLVHPFDDPLVIAGQGTIGDEILRHARGDLSAIFVPVGGGGLIGGIGAFIKTLAPEVRLIGVEPFEADAMMYQSLAKGTCVRLEHVGIFADGVAVREVGKHTLPIGLEVIDEVVRAQARDERFVAVLTGANMNFDRLRFVAERAELGEAREAIFAVTIPEEAGAFRAFCKAIGRRVVTEFNYRLRGRSEAHIFVGVSVDSRDDARALAEELRQLGHETVDLSDDEMAKVHVRHMVGGRTSEVRDEWPCRFQFPERPGALMEFLDALGGRWNISLFHYRNHGSDFGRVLAAFEVPPAEREAFQTFLDELGYPYTPEPDNVAFRLFL